MQRIRFMAILAIVVCVGVTCLAASARFTYHHPFAPRERFVVTSTGYVVHADRMTSRRLRDKERQVEDAGRPKAVVECDVYDFGVMNPLTRNYHTFLIRNLGNAPLKIPKGPTSCKCTLSHLSHSRIQPDCHTLVRVDWHTGTKAGLFSHHVTIRTNDPERETVLLEVRGKVEELIASDPPEIHFDRVLPGEAGQANLLLYSHYWKSFEVVSGKSSQEGLNWEVMPVDQATLDAHDAKSGYRIRITSASGLSVGQFTDWFQLTMVPTDEAADHESITVQWSVTGEVVGRLGVFGNSINSDGVVNLGRPSLGERSQQILLLKVRDEVRDLKLARIVTEPDFIRARLLPQEGHLRDPGLYQLMLEIPDTAPLCTYLGLKLGSLRLEFDHPRISHLDLKLQFAVGE